MSDDIVTRLKDVMNCLTVEEQQDIVDEAAGEIERLREQNEYLKANVNMLLSEARELRALREACKEHHSV